MNEYELCNRILSPNLKPQNQALLIEQKLERPHKAYIVDSGKGHWTLYRYDQDEDPKLFLPFFNNTRDENKSPRDLLKFCDYFVLVEKNDKLFILLIEMKSGRTKDAIKQLEASKTFMHYILKTAERIAPANDYREIDISKVCIRKIILKPQLKPTTNKAKSEDSQIDLKTDVITLSSQTLPLVQLCKTK
jgi:hypothetical protein